MKISPSRLSSLTKILNSVSQTTQGLGMGKLAGLPFDKSLPKDIRIAARNLSSLSTTLITEHKIDPVAVADHMLEELDQMRSAKEAAEQTIRSLKEQLLERPEADKLIEQEEKVADLTSRMGTLELELNQAKAEARDKESQLQSELLQVESLKSKVKGLTRELTEIREIKVAIEEREKSLRDQLLQMENDLEKTLAEKVAAEENIAILVEEKQGLERQVDAQKGILDQRDSVINNLNESLGHARFQKEAADKKILELVPQVETLNTELNQAREKAQSLGEQLAQAKADCTRVRAVKDNVSQNVQELSNRIQSLEVELRGTEKEAKERKDQLEVVLREKAQLRTEMHTSIAELKDSKAAADKTIRQLAEEIKRLQHVQQDREARLEKQSQISVQLSTQLREVRAERKKALWNKDILKSQVKTLTREKDQAQKELAEIKKTAEPFLKLQRVWESVDPEVVGTWLVIFNWINTQVKNIHDRRELYFMTASIADYLIKTGASDITLYFRNLDPEDIDKMIERICDPRRSAILPLHSEKWPEKFKTITNLPVANQLRMLTSRSLDPLAYEQVLQHLILYNLDEVREARSSDEKVLRVAANLVWRRWLGSLLEYFLMHPQNETAYEKQLASIVSDRDTLQDTLEGLKSIRKDTRAKKMAKKFQNDAEAKARTKNKI